MMIMIKLLVMATMGDGKSWMKIDVVKYVSLFVEIKFANESYDTLKKSRQWYLNEWFQ